MVMDSRHLFKKSARDMFNNIRLFLASAVPLLYTAGIAHISRRGLFKTV